MAGPVAWLIVLALALGCGGCAGKTLVALAPDPDGKVGGVTVHNRAGTVDLDRAYQATVAAAADQAPEAPVQLEREAVQARFAEALASQPLRPVHFLLYFDKDARLTAASNELLEEVTRAIRERNSEDISVIGHTDTVGSSEYNNELSRRRALTVKDLLVGRGVPAGQIRVTSHGKENPLIPTADNVYEPRNRRVEVDVR